MLTRARDPGCGGHRAQASSVPPAAFAMVMRLSAAVPRAAAVALVLVAVAVFTLGKMIESPVMAASASEAAPDALRGR